MDRLFPPLLVVGLVISGLGAATAVSIFEGDGRTISVPEDDEDLEDLVEDKALDGFSPATAPPPTPSADPAPKVATKAAPVSRAVPESRSGPRPPRSSRDEAEGGGATNPPGSNDTAVGVGPDINDGQGLPADPND